MRIAVLGAGGLGSQLGATLHEAGRDVHLVARGDHLKALAERGLEVVDAGGRRRLRIACSSGTDLVQPFDIAFVTVKAQALEGVASLAGELGRAGAWVVPLVNGVDAVERLAAAGVPAGQLVAGVAYLTAFRTRPGVVERKGAHQRFSFGPVPDLGERVHPLVEAFAGTACQVDLPVDIHAELWRKMAVVCALAAVCGATGKALGGARGTQKGRELQIGTVGEVLSVAQALGVAVGPDDEARTHAILDRFPDDFFPSLLHDLRQRRPTEVDALNATVSTLGRSVGIPTPCNDYATAAIRAAEPDRV